METKDKVSIIVPVYNGAKSVERLVDVIFKELSSIIDVEVVLVNDFSPDNSWEKIQAAHQKYPKNVVGVNLSKNFGEHNAVMAGYNHCTGDYIVNIDDDFQNPPREILKLLKALKDGKHEVVYSFYEKKQHHFLRNLGSWFNGTVATMMLGKPKDLYLCSFRIITKNLLMQIKQYNGPYPYIDGLILRATRKIHSVKVEHIARQDGESNYTFIKLLRLWSFMFLNFSVKPLRMASLLGLAISTIGFIFALFVVIEKIMDPSIQLGWASIMTAILILSGTQLIMLGLVGEYVGRIFISQNCSPQYTVYELLKDG